jgi:hypothetical protein
MARSSRSTDWIESDVEKPRHRPGLFVVPDATKMPLARRYLPMIEKPPSTAIAAPVTKSDARDARNTAMPAKSEISPQRAAACAPARAHARRRSLRARLVGSVSIQPGRAQPYLKLRRPVRVGGAPPIAMAASPKSRASGDKALRPQDIAPVDRLVAVPQQLRQISYGRKCYRTWASLWRYIVQNAQGAGGLNVRAIIKAAYRGLKLDRLLINQFQHTRM